MLMKKILFVIALLIGGNALFTPQIQAAQEDPEICIPGKPCAYDGYAVSEGNSRIKIQVYVVGGQFVARFYDDEKKVREAYAIKCGLCEYYINWGGIKYYFEM